MVLQALLNSHYSYQIGQLSCQLRSAITCLVFKKSLLVSTVDMTLFSSGEIWQSSACNALLACDQDPTVQLPVTQTPACRMCMACKKVLVNSA